MQGEVKVDSQMQGNGTNALFTPVGADGCPLRETAGPVGR